MPFPVGEGARGPARGRMRGGLPVAAHARVVMVNSALISQWSGPLTASPAGEAISKKACTHTGHTPFLLQFYRYSFTFSIRVAFSTARIMTPTSGKGILLVYVFFFRFYPVTAIAVMYIDAVFSAIMLLIICSASFIKAFIIHPIEMLTAQTRCNKCGNRIFYISIVWWLNTLKFRLR